MSQPLEVANSVLTGVAANRSQSAGPEIWVRRSTSTKAQRQTAIIRRLKGKRKYNWTAGAMIRQFKALDAAKAVAQGCLVRWRER